jgi:hypothetical protein
MAVVRENIFTNPRTQTTATMGFTNGTASAVDTTQFPPALKAYQWVRNTTALGRISVSSSGFLPSTEYTLRFSLMSTVTTSYPVYYRTSVSSTSGQLSLPSVNATAGVPVDVAIKFTTTATATSGATGIAITPFGRPTFDEIVQVTKFSLILGDALDEPWFCGASADTGLRDYAWVGTADASRSTSTIATDSPERTIPYPYGESVATNSKADLVVRYRSGWIG